MSKVGFCIDYWVTLKKFYENMSMLRLIDHEGNALLEVTLTISREYKEWSITHRLNWFDDDDFRDVTKFYDNDVMVKQILVVHYFTEDDRAREQSDLVNEVKVGEMMHFAIGIQRKSIKIYLNGH